MTVMALGFALGSAWRWASASVYRCALALVFASASASMWESAMVGRWTLPSRLESKESASRLASLLLERR